MVWEAAKRAAPCSGEWWRVPLQRRTSILGGLTAQHLAVVTSGPPASSSSGLLRLQSCFAQGHLLCGPGTEWDRNIKALSFWPSLGCSAIPCWVGQDPARTNQPFPLPMTSILSQKLLLESNLPLTGSQVSRKQPAAYRKSSIFSLLVMGGHILRVSIWEEAS